MPNRSALTAKLNDPTPWDVIVIGGGATGFGVAVDAASRGYKTLLIEGDDFAKGTSSRATKLVHGGVRYLAQGNISLVRDALRERGLLRQNAPHLVRNLGFVIPSFDWWAAPFYGIGMKVYDALAGSLNLAPSQILNRDQTLAHLPTLRQNGLRGGVLYHDGQFDDARLAITLMRTLFDLSGTAINHMRVSGLLKHNSRITGVIATDTETSNTFELHAGCVINATGVFVDDVRRMDDANARAMLSPSQGAHLVVDAKFIPGNDALMVPKTDDGRVLFGVPWHGKVILGTTDTAVENTTLEPRPLPQEIEFILGTAKRYLETAPTANDVRSVYAGLRPLVKNDGAGNTASLSRDHTIRISETGLITVTGGKWTTYRKMGEDVIDHAIKAGQLKAAPSRTETLALHGHSTEHQPDGLAVYGSDTNALLALPGAQTQLHPEIFLLEAQVRYAARHELARSVEDVLARRSRVLLLNAQASLEAAPKVAAILGEELGWDDTKQHAQLEAYTALAKGYMLP